MNNPPVDVQDSFFYALRHDEIPIEVRLVNGESRIGRLKRFDKFAVVLDVSGVEEMVYKHAIASIRAQRPSAHPPSAPPAP